MSRKTEWRELADSSFAGLGQRLLATDAGEYPLLEVREIIFDPRA
jgi:type VI secretion system protein ImpE